MSKAPIIIVTAKEISLVVGQGDRMSMTSGDELDAVKLEAALKKLPAGTPRVLVLQADAATSAKVINDIVMTASKADIDDVLFAVKNR